MERYHRPLRNNLVGDYKRTAGQRFARQADQRPLTSFGLLLTSFILVQLAFFRENPSLPALIPVVLTSFSIQNRQCTGRYCDCRIHRSQGQRCSLFRMWAS